MFIVFDANLMMLKKIIFLVLAICISALLLNYLLDVQVIKTMKDMMGRVNYLFLVFALILTPLIQYFRAWRFNILVKGNNSKPDFNIYKITSLLLFFNYLLPFKTGELSFPILINRYYGMSVLQASGILIFTRILDLLCLVSIFFITGSMLLDQGIQDLSRSAMISIGLLSTGLFVMSPIIARLVKRRGQSVITNNSRVSLIIEKLFGFAQSVSMTRTPSHLLLLTVFIWLLQTLVAACAVLSLGIFVAPVELLFASSAGSVALGLPINGIAGLGPIQAAWAYTLSLGSVTRDIGIITGFLWHAILVTGAVLLAMIVSLLSIKKV